MSSPPALLVVGAHAADFVWRAAGVIALHTNSGGEATAVALSYGERGESGDLWKEPDQTIENVKRIRHEEARAAARAVGADFVPFDLGDYPLIASDDTVERLVALMRQVSPGVVITHTLTDPFNPDHPVASALVDRARKIAIGGAGIPSAFPTIAPPRFYYFEPHHPELCGFTPNTFIDITSVGEQKEEAMAAMGAQSYLREHYRERSRQRALQSRYFGATDKVLQVEAFQLATPRFTDRL